MKWFYDMKIGKKIISTFVLVAVFSSMLIGIVALLNITSINSISESMYKENLVPLEPIYRAEVDLLKMRMAVRDMALSKEADRAKYSNVINELEKSLNNNLNSYSKNVSSQEEEANYKTITNELQRYFTVRDNVINLIKSNQIDNAMGYMNGEASVVAKELDDSINNAFKINTTQANNRNTANTSKGSTAILWMIGIVLFAILLSSVLGTYIAKIIARPVNKLMDAATKLSKGNLDINLEINTKDELGSLADAFKELIVSIKNLTADANMLAQAAIEGMFERRADTSKHNGEFRTIVEGVNATLDTVVDKTTWYEAIIDAVPFPIHVTDNNMSWTYMNKAFEKLMRDAGVVRERKDGYGKACSNAGANICNTANCGIKQLQKGVPVSYFDWCGMSCKQDTSYLKNKKGESIGYVEVVTDLTSILRVNEYNKLEIERLAINLDMLAKGDMNLNLTIKEADEYTAEAYQNFSKINKNLEKAGNAVGELIKDALMLSDAAVEGKLETRADASKHQGDFRRIVEGVNATLDTVVDKTTWYEAIIDAVPFPIHVTDNNMSWTYMNKGFEQLMIDAGVVRERKDGYGKACSNAGANICNTANCGIKQLQKGVPVSYFDWCGMSCKQDTSYLKNKKGDKIGYVEVVTDLTSILRVNEYNKLEVERLAINLDMLAKGDMNLNLNIKEADEYTAEAYQNFSKINKNLEKAGNAVGELIRDALMLSDAAVEGKLETRADASKHQGDFRRIVEGVNATLDAVIKPLDEAQKVMKLMSVNDFTVEMTGQYKGMLKDFAQSINDVHNRLVFVQEAMVDLSEGDTCKLTELEKTGKRSENDQLVPAFIAMMRSIQGLTNEAGKLAQAAVAGDLKVRGDAAKFEGGYREIIDGMNRTMEAIEVPLSEMGNVLLEMEKGNLTVNMTGSYQGNYEKLKNAINSTIETFNDVLNEINTSAQQVASGARQVSDSAQILSQGSTEQASSVEELTASLEEVAVQTKQNAINANQANELATTAKENAVQGNDQMGAMLKAMEEINESSGNISKIIKVIDDIAFQTNILALNAAVEAARAGQHGKGFAVVAEEVRNLAARSANAAKETTGLIEGSIKKAEGGTKIANETAVALNKIVDGVAKAASLVGGIAAASDEQAAAITQINQGIIQVSQVTQTNSATSEESAAASEELSSQAELLNEMVGKFKLRKNGSKLKNLEEINPEILEMLEGMKGKKKSSGTFERKSEPTVSKMKIALSDNEFGKY